MATRTKRSKSAIGSVKSWERANKLYNLADYGNVAMARSFIATNKDEYVPLLDGTADKRNKKIRSIISDYQKWVTVINRRARK